MTLAFRRTASTRATLRAFSIWKKIGDNPALVVSIFGLTVSLSQFLLNRGQSTGGKVRRAVRQMMKPYEPNRRKEEVVDRNIIQRIADRIEHWQEHATIVAGRFGSGKSVALEEALRGLRGVYIHRVRGKDWEQELYKQLLGADDPNMFMQVLEQVKLRLKKAPVLVLDIPRSTKEGRGFFRVSFFKKVWTQSPASPRHCQRTWTCYMPGPCFRTLKGRKV